MFADVRLYDGHSDPDYILSGRLEKLEEIDDAKRVRVEVGLSAQLVDTHSGKTVWANSASESCGVDQRSVSAVVAEMSHTMDRAIQSLLSSLSIPAMQAAN